jgi:GTP1/Obg family GTP-binding protein
MTLAYNDKPLKASKVITEVNNRLLKSEGRKDFYIVTTWDEVSKYLCNKAFPILSEFERKVRKLVYLILLKLFGPEWFDKTVTDSLEKKLKEAARGNRIKLIESALSEMTMAQLEVFLFAPYSICSFDDIDKRYTEEEIKNMDKDKLIEIITPCLKKSLWDRYFKEIDISLDVLVSLREYRNLIAHNKEFHYSKYKAFQRVAKGIIRKIDSAIQDILESELINNQIGNGISALINMAVTFNMVKFAFADLSPTLEKIREMEEAYKASVKWSPVLEKIREIQEAAKASVKLSPASEKIREMEEAYKASVKWSPVLEKIREIQEAAKASVKLSPASEKIREMEEAYKASVKWSPALEKIREIQEAAKASSLIAQMREIQDTYKMFSLIVEIKDMQDADKVPRQENKKPSGETEIENQNDESKEDNEKDIE